MPNQMHSEPRSHAFESRTTGAGGLRRRETTRKGAKRPTTPIEMTTGGRYEFLARANRVIST